MEMHVTFYRHFIRCEALMQMTYFSPRKIQQQQQQKWFQFQSKPRFYDCETHWEHFIDLVEFLSFKRQNY